MPRAKAEGGGAAAATALSTNVELVDRAKAQLATLRACEAELDVELSELQEAKKRSAVKRVKAKRDAPLTLTAVAGGGHGVVIDIVSSSLVNPPTK